MAVNYKTIRVENLSTIASVYTVPNGQTACIVSFFVCNKTANAADVSVIIRSGGIDYYLNKEIPLATNATLQPSDGKKIFLAQAELVYIESTENVDIIMSILENI